VVDVVRGSPADKGGLRPCDLIESIDGRAVKNPSEVQLAVDRGRVNQPLQMEVRRGGNREQLTLRPAELPREG